MASMSSGAVATFNGGCFGVVTFFYVVAAWRRWTTEARLQSPVDKIGEPLLARLASRLPWNDRFLFAGYLLYVAHFVLLNLATQISRQFHEDGAPSQETSKLVFASRIILTIIWQCANFATAFLLVRIISQANEHQRLINFFVVYNLLAAILAGFLIAYSCSPSHVYRGHGPDTFPSRWYFWVVAVIPNAIFDLIIFAWFLPRKVVSQVRPGKGRVVIFSFLPKISLWPVYILYTYYTWKTPQNMTASICLQIGMATLTIGVSIVPACQRFFDEFKTSGLLVVTRQEDEAGRTQVLGKDRVMTQASTKPISASLKSSSSTDPIMAAEPIRAGDKVDWFMKSRHEMPSSKTTVR